MMNLKKHNTLYLLVVVVVGLIVSLPGLDFQAGIAQGDHGLNLYAFGQTQAGKVPYQDYLWYAGPLMPYYYGLFFHVLGASLQTVMVAKGLLLIMSGIFCFLALQTCLSPLTALTAAVWYTIFNPQFTHSYNHIGATAMMMPALFFILQYIQTKNRRFLWGNLVCFFVINCIRLNIGLSLGVATAAVVWLKDRSSSSGTGQSNLLFYLSGLGGITLITAGVYLFFLKGLPLDYIHQCFPYLGMSQSQGPISLIEALKSYLLIARTAAFATRYIYSFFFAVVIISVIHAVRVFMRRGTNKTQLKHSFFVISVLGLYHVITLHEFLKSGVYYRLYWSVPFLFMAAFVVIDLLLSKLQRHLRLVVLLTLLFCCGYVFMGRTNWKTHFKDSTSTQYLSSPAGRFYAQNRPQWFKTVKETAAFLDNVLGPNETFFALPYDALYYFLTQKQSPSRMLMFFKHNNITDEQQAQIVASLEGRGINTILISNRAYSKEEGMGYFGKTHCLILARYIEQHFVPIAQFGDWDKEPHYMANHATRILKRKRGR